MSSHVITSLSAIYPPRFESIHLSVAYNANSSLHEAAPTRYTHKRGALRRQHQSELDKPYTWFSRPCSPNGNLSPRSSALSVGRPMWANINRRTP